MRISSSHPVVRVPLSIVLLAMLMVPPLLPRAVQAQSSSRDAIPEVTQTYALVNARIVQAPGQVIDRGTVVIRDGLILGVGANVDIPFDAQRIDGASFTVYAGLIDGLSHAGVPEPEPMRNQPPVDSANPPNDRAGIQPDRDVRALLNPTDESIATMRNLGFTAAHTVPHGRMLPGTGAVVLLGGADATAMTHSGEASLFAQFQTAQGRIYPSTPMGILAKYRQLYREASRRQHMERVYAEDPTGMERPEYDPVHYAFFPVLDGQRRVFFHTTSAVEIHRAMALQQDLGFSMVLTGLNQGFDVIDKLKAAGMPLLLTVDLPEEPEVEEGEEEGEMEAVDPEAYDADLRTMTYEDVEAEKKNLEARQALERRKYYSAAAEMHAAGLRFGFTTLGVEAKDVMKNVRTMIAHGLPADVALAALTTHTADILGVASSMGTIEAGKVANLIVTTGPLFDEGTQIKHVFVDGHRFEVEQGEERGRPGRRRSTQ